MKKLALLVMLSTTAFLFFTGNAFGADFCVSDETGFYDALSTAGSNGEDDTIKVAQGIYTGNFSYLSYGGETNSVTILGGYTSGFGDRVLDPANTILDGGETDDRVLELYTPGTGASFYVEGFTIQNGNCESSGGGIFAFTSKDSTTGGTITIKNNIISGNTGLGGGGIYAFNQATTGAAGDIIISGNTIIDNHTTNNTGGGVSATADSNSSGTAGDINLINNIIARNSSAGITNAGGVYASSNSTSGTDGTITLTNNTITGNSANNTGGGISLYRAGTIHCYNNIISGNTALSSFDISFIGSAGTANGFNNNYSGTVAWNNEDGNIDVDPLFVNVSTDNYRLRPRSLCIDAGETEAPQIPGSDIEGNERIIDGNRDGTADVDMGAYEYVPRSILMHMLLLFSD